MAVEITKDAYACLHDILMTEEEHFTKRYKKYMRDIDTAFHGLDSGELTGNIRPEIGDNVYSYRSHDHLIYYLEQEHGITILSVLHYLTDPTQTKKKRRAKPRCESGSLFAED
ncbi:type II toxin-antitoxin system RelE/ParE family toxin [Aquimarina aggregata]|uniref:type II toxin-antitoxin system RelE/ParE family toxin n=1 Tax=Aquimarina aggregata TaxID=1642818 RepID=UPI002491F8D0|nr:type II toxin-antitoxin system RelE/ParE family toxin [Aquimarina aggregata]